MKPRTEESVFILLLTVVAAVFIISSLQISRFEVAKVPLLIAVPTFIGLLWQAARVFIPRWNAFLESRLKKAEAKKQAFDLESTDEETRPQLGKRLLFSFWLVLFAAATYFLGFLYSIPILLIVYFRWMEKLTWVKTLAAAAGYTLFMYLFFSLVLKAI